MCKLYVNNNNNKMSLEELRIRGELEKDIERELEKEIKDGICGLALRLHRLYHHDQKKMAERKNRLLSHEEVISIIINIVRSEGHDHETRIEVKEMIKKNIQEKTGGGGNLVHHQKNIVPKSKKFDWTKSLRSSNSLHVDIIRGKKGVGKNMVKNKADKIMQLELGWKD